MLQDAVATIANLSAVLFISIHTLRGHRENIIKKLNLKGIIDLVKYLLPNVQYCSTSLAYRFRSSF